MDGRTRRTDGRTDGRTDVHPRSFVRPFFKAYTATPRARGSIGRTDADGKEKERSDYRVQTDGQTVSQVSR